MNQRNTTTKVTYPAKQSHPFDRIITFLPKGVNRREKSMNNMNECCGITANIGKAPIPMNKMNESTGDIIQNIREIISDIEDQSNTIRAKIKGTIPRPCNTSENPEPCVINYLEGIRIQLRDIRETLLEANISL
jgi:hypothetical protein